MTVTVYFNGEYMPKEQVSISPDDRGFLFADGIYEVVRSYDGRLFELDAHLGRLANGLRALRIDGVDVNGLGDVVRRLIAENQLVRGDATVYLQVTRGAAPRVHAFPDPPVPPTLYAEARRLEPRGDPAIGVAVITVPDTRWARCNIKSIGLLANCLASQRAREAGAVEAVFVRDGVALEASASSLFAVIGGEVRTGPITNYVLPSITRAVVQRLCAEAGIPHRETPIFVDEIPGADELFLAGTTLEVMPVVSVDGVEIGAGTPGPVTRRLYDLFKLETARAGV